MEHTGDAMIIKCGKCDTSFSVDRAIVNTEGSSARCSVCRNIFIIYPDSGESAAEPFIISDDMGEDDMMMDDLFAHRVHRPRKSRKLFVFVILLFFIGILAAGGWYSLKTNLINPDRVNDSVKRFGAILSGLGNYFDIESADTGNADSKIIIKNIQTRVVENRTAGKLLIVQGDAKNQYPGTRNYIRLKVRVYATKTGLLMDASEVYCGNMLEAGELKSLSMTEMTRRLGNPEGDSGANMNLTHGDSLPFMAVFKISGDGGDDFNVEVEEALLSGS